MTQAEAAERARLLDVSSYDIVLDLTDGMGGPGERTFHTTTEIRFRCVEPGATTFIEVAAERIRGATLNGTPLDTSGWAPEQGLTIPGLAADNVLVVDADFPYSSSGQGLHRSVDPVDKEVYLYSQFETADAQRAFACFDQPDLKSVYTWHVTAPAHWNVISNAPAEGTDGTTVHFAQSARMSTYITALCAGPYHEVRETHDGIDLGLFCRASMARYLDPADIFLVTRQGFDFFHEQFGIRYPLPKYDQVFVPEYNAGAMENFGCVVHAEQHYLYRSQVTDYDYEQRANTILHEMAHMWFGDLVTMRWWDDLWLNESFAEWASHWCNTEATRFTDAWATFLSIRKNWGYRQDQLSSTHPVYCEMPDVAAVEVNFDGITYAKGASVLKQLVAYVGLDAFVAGLRAYFVKHAWGNATFDDLLSALEAASGRELRKFAAQWLETAQVNTLRPEVSIADGLYGTVAVRQEAPADYPTLRTHRIGVGLYDLTDDGRLTRRERIEIDVTGARTEVPALAGTRAADVLLLNDDDLTYAKLRLDDRSMATVVRHIAGFDDALARSLCWAAAWDMTRDAELAGRDYVALALAGLPAERDVNLITATLRNVTGTLSQYVDPAWARTGWAGLADTALAATRAAEPGDLRTGLGRRASDAPSQTGLQLTWARAFASAALRGSDVAVVRSWLDGTDVPPGLAIDTEMRWTLLVALVTAGAAGPDEIEAELARDRTSNGERQAALARALVATPESKQETWRRVVTDFELPNWLQRAMLQGFQHPAQAELTARYTQAFFDAVGEVWARRDGELAQDFAVLGYPYLAISDDTIARTDAWLREDGHPAPLRRLVAEGKDGIVRSLKARAKDAAAR